MNKKNTGTKDPRIAGALFDFAGWLTSLKDVVKIGATEHAGIMADLLVEWAGLSGLDLDDADVKGWNSCYNENIVTIQPMISISPIAMLHAEWVKQGLCPRCGDRGEWINMAAVCKEHGQFIG